jgi:two-component system, chemotaxis family, CheB/CheR fusion protein
VLADNIYLIPPKKNLTIFHGKLLLTDQEANKGVNLPIDVFFRSLAEDQQEKAVAVVLSGTGSDGMRGVRLIKEYGGMVMVQSEESAKFDGMPRAAASTGLADYVLSAEEMPNQLLAFTRHPYATRVERSETLLSDEDGLTRIFAILREKCKVDFTNYKPSTVTRRIERRMSVNQTENIRDYVAYLQNYPAEVNALFRELLIGVTSFYRDPQVFEQLNAKWLPEILEMEKNKEVRLWVAGCSTGEEAYSLAIAISEVMDAQSDFRDIKIFATDIDREALQYAAAGVYPESIAADLSPRLLAKYFHKKDDRFQIARQIREMVVFAQHNLIKDPPFTNISLVSCRNLLIYLQPVLQRRVLEYFNFSLKPGGILVLGTSETTGEMGEFFETQDTRLKIYRSRGRQKALNEHYALPSTPTDTRASDLRSQYAGARRALRSAEEERTMERFLDSITPDYLPLTLIVNEAMEVLHIFGSPEGYFKLPSGKLINDISKMAAKELAIPLVTGIQKVLQKNQEIVFSNIRINRNQLDQVVSLRIRPIPAKKGQEKLVAVLIEPVKTTQALLDAAPAYDLSKEAEERLRDMEQELQFTRENLQATIEELETSNEELQATNEELLASNEELQSTNEELQSTNEELFTVNAEYQSKILELTELHNDIENLLQATDLGILVLDENMEVRRFSAPIAQVFRILDSDIGRPITHITHNLLYTDPVASIRSVQKTGVSVEMEVVSSTGGWYLMRVSPYAIGPKNFSGSVLTLIDIDPIKNAQAAQKHSENEYRTLFETMPHGVVYQNREGEIVAANPAAEQILGLSLAQMQGRTSVTPQWRACRPDGSNFPGEEHPSMVALREARKVENVIMGVFNPRKKEMTWIKVNAIPQFGNNPDVPESVYTTFEDITDAYNLSNALQESQNHYQQLFTQMGSAFAVHQILLDKDGKPYNYQFLQVNRAFETHTGLKASEVVGKTVLEVIPGIEPEWIERYGKVAIRRETVDFTAYNRTTGKEYKVHAYSPAPGQFATIFINLQNPTENDER